MLRLSGISGKNLRTIAKRLFQRPSTRSIAVIATCGTIFAKYTTSTCNSVCQPVTPIIVLPANTSVDHTAQKVVSVLDSSCAFLENTIMWIWSCLLTAVRCGRLAFTFSPVLVTLPAVYSLANDTIYEWWWCCFRASICSAGPTFIKFAQWASMRADLFGTKVCVELSKLQGGVSPHPWYQTEQALRRILGEDWSDTLQLQQQPVGSGCVAQVYKGKLKRRSVSSASRDSEESMDVAVKILHPGVRETMETDLALMRSVAHMAEYVGESLLRLLYTKKDGSLDTAAIAESYPLRCVSLLESVEEFAVFMRSQLDMRNEAAALNRLRQNFSESAWADRIIIPQPIYESVGADDSSLPRYQLPHPDVLVETFEQGVSMSRVLNRIAGAERTLQALDDTSIAQQEEQQVRYREIAALGLDALLKMLFEDNFIHADLHAGNLLVRNAPPRPQSPSPLHQQLVLLDAGLTVELAPFDRRNFISLFKAVIEDDGREVARLMMEYSPKRANIRNASTGVRHSGAAIEEVYATVLRPEEYQEQMAALVHRVHEGGLSLKNVSVGALLRDVLQLSYDHNVKLESRFVTVVVAIMLAEGMGRRLDPEVDIIERAKPFIRAAAIKMALGRK